MSSKKTQGPTGKKPFVPPAYTFKKKENSASPVQTKKSVPGAPSFHPPPLTKTQANVVSTPPISPPPGNSVTSKASQHSTPYYNNQQSPQQYPNVPMQPQHQGFNQGFNHQPSPQQQQSPYQYANQQYPQFQPQQYNSYAPTQSQQQQQWLYQNSSQQYPQFQQPPQQFPNGLTQSQQQLQLLYQNPNQQYPQFQQPPQQFPNGLTQSQQQLQLLYQNPNQQYVQPQSQQSNSYAPIQSQQQPLFPSGQFQPQPQFLNGSLSSQQQQQQQGTASQTPTTPPSEANVNSNQVTNDGEKEVKQTPDKTSEEKPIVDEPKEGGADKNEEKKSLNVIESDNANAAKMDEEKPLDLNNEGESDGKSVETDKDKENDEKPIEADKDKEIDEKPIEMNEGKEIDEKPIEADKDKEIDEKPMEINEGKENDEKPIEMNEDKTPNEENKVTDDSKPKDGKEDKVTNETDKEKEKQNDEKKKDKDTKRSLNDSTKKEEKKEKEKEYTLETISGHENDVLQKFIETKDVKYSKLLLEHYSRTGIKKFDFTQANMMYSNLIPLKDDEPVTDLLLSILASNQKICTIARIKVLLNPQYVLALKEKDLRTVTGILKNVLTSSNYTGSKHDEIVSSLVNLLEADPAHKLPLPLWELLADIAEASKAKASMYEPILKHMTLSTVEGDTLECAVKILTNLAAGQQKYFSGYKVLLKVFEKYGAAPSFFDFFIHSCSKIFAKTGKPVSKGSVLSDDFARVLSGIILDEASPNKRNISVLSALSSIFMRKPKPSAPEVKALSLKAVRAFIADNKDVPALVAGLTILRGAFSKVTPGGKKGGEKEKEDEDEGALITEMIFDCPQALEDRTVATLLCLIMQREALRRELTEKELKVIGTLAVRDGTDTPLFAIIAGIVANALYAKDKPSTPCERLKGVVGTLAGKVSAPAAPVPIRSAELLSNIFLVVKNVAASAVAFKGGYSELLAEKEELFVRVLSDHAPFLYEACTKKPKSTLVKHLIKTLLEAALLLTHAKELPAKLYDAVDNFYKYFSNNSDQAGAKEIRNVILKIYLVNTSKSDVGKALLAQPKSKVLQLLFEELNLYSQNSGGVNTGRVVAIFGVLCNVLCLELPKDALDMEKVVEATLKLLSARKFPLNVNVAGSRLIWRIASRKDGKKLVEKHSKEFVNCFTKVMSEVGEPTGKESDVEGIATILNAFVFMVVSSKSVVKVLENHHASRIITFINKIRSYPRVLQTTIKLISYLMKQSRTMCEYFKKCQFAPGVERYF